MKKVFVTLSLLIGSFVAVNAQTTVTPEYQKEVAELVQAAHMKELLVSTIAESWKSLNLPIGDYKKVSQDVVDDIWPGLVQDYTEEYAKFLDLSDIKNLVNFYKSPTGQKFVLNHNTMTANVMQTMQTKYATRIQETLMKNLKQ